MIEMNQLQSGIVEAASKVRASNPMAGSITNSVTIDFVANAQLAVGGSAAMVYLPDEGECLVAAGGAIYINMGTLLPVYEGNFPAHCAAAHAAGKPWVLDPVGIGIGSLRTKLLRGFKPYKPAIVRGNASEVIACRPLGPGRRRERAFPCPRRHYHRHGGSRARRSRGPCALHGRRGGRLGRVRPGHRWVDRGIFHRRQRAYGQGNGLRGCSLGGVAAVYATQADPFTAALAAVAHYNVAGTRAAAAADAPASFKVAFIDELPRNARRYREQPAARIEA